MTYADDNGFGDYDLLYLQPRVASRIVRNSWKTKTGKLITIRKMTISHLKNAYAMFREPRLLAEINRRNSVSLQ